MACASLSACLYGLHLTLRFRLFSVELFVVESVAFFVTATNFRRECKGQSAGFIWPRAMKIYKLVISPFLPNVAMSASAPL